jgi:cell division septum initiation protein DivIVA
MASTMSFIAESYRRVWATRQDETVLIAGNRADRPSDGPWAGAMVSRHGACPVASRAGEATQVGSTPEDIEARALRARAEAEANAIRGRAEVDATAVISAADADADAIRARAELEVDELRQAAESDREEAQRLLVEARRQCDQMLAEANDLRRRTEQETLDRLLATRADLHGAIARLTEMTDAVLDITDETEGVVDGDPEGPAEPGESDAGSSSDEDVVGQVVRSAIGRAVDSASAAARSPKWAADRPARRREQLRDGRTIL